MFWHNVLSCTQNSKPLNLSFLFKKGVSPIHKMHYTLTHPIPEPGSILHPFPFDLLQDAVLASAFSNNDSDATMILVGYHLCPWVKRAGGRGGIREAAYRVYSVRKKMHHCVGITAIVTSSWDDRTFAHKSHLFHFDGFNQIKSFIVGSSMLHRAVKPGCVCPGQSLPAVNEDLHGSPTA